MQPARRLTRRAPSRQLTTTRGHSPCQMKMRPTDGMARPRMQESTRVACMVAGFARIRAICVAVDDPPGSLATSATSATSVSAHWEPLPRLSPRATSVSIPPGSSLDVLLGQDTSPRHAGPHDPDHDHGSRARRANGVRAPGRVRRTGLPQAGRNLLLPAPDIQENILFLPPTTAGRDLVTELGVRDVLAESSFRKQRDVWREIVDAEP